MHLINFSNFIQTTRDSGYKSIASAVSELIDNSFEAEARIVKLNFCKEGNCITVSDNGKGMNKATLNFALQFGGSSRYNSRIGFGRYGMGLPNSSLSQSRRVEVYTWEKDSKTLFCYLDIDEIIKSNSSHLPKPTIDNKIVQPFESGTIIKWTNCDRLRYKRERTILHELKVSLGQAFRKQLYNEKQIYVNEQKLEPIDPLFLHSGNNLFGANLYGPPLYYKIRIPNSDKCSVVKVTFSLLPIEDWTFYSNEEKQKHKITKCAGVSIIRAGREIDYGWYFVGTKRKENYDDWWRCEIQFEPELDELFGVTHTKQEIHPTTELLEILTPDIEKIARELNRKVRTKFLEIKQNNKKTYIERKAASNDHLLDPIHKSENKKNFITVTVSRRKKIKATNYKINVINTDLKSFFIPTFKKNTLFLSYNRNHLFYKKFYNENSSKLANDNIELILLSVARTECELKSKQNEHFFETFRTIWSKNLGNFLQ